MSVGDIHRFQHRRQRQGSLAYEISQAHSSSGATTSNFDPKVFATPQTITLDGSVLTLTNTQGMETITGPSAGVIISGGEQSRVFQVDSGVTASLSGLMITGDKVGTNDSGGGLYNQSKSTLDDCTISGNSAGDGAAACTIRARRP